VDLPPVLCLQRACKLAVSRCRLCMPLHNKAPRRATALGPLPRCRSLQCLVYSSAWSPYVPAHRWSVGVLSMQMRSSLKRSMAFGLVAAQNRHFCTPAPVQRPNHHEMLSCRSAVTMLTMTAMCKQDSGIN
jgi:hypothetical protein